MRPLVTRPDVGSSDQSEEVLMRVMSIIADMPVPDLERARDFYADYLGHDVDASGRSRRRRGAGRASDRGAVHHRGDSQEPRHGVPQADPRAEGEGGAIGRRRIGSVIV